VKLIDILVQELPKLGGWPDGIDDIEMLSDGTIYFNGDIAPVYYKLTQCSDGWSRLKSAKDYSNAVTREQYETALAASNPEWNGEGLPPVGTECEYSLNAGRTWFKCKIDYVLGTQGLIMLADVYEGGQFVGFAEYDGKLKFRPIRSEADKKKEAAIFAIAEVCRSSASNGHSAELIYDAIKSGKIVID
jgi:hypothetical protein